VTNVRKAGAALTLATITSLTTAAAVSASTSTPAPTESDAEAAFTEAHRPDAKFGQTEAEKTATGVHRGETSDVHLEIEDKGLVWEVKVGDGSNVWEVQVNATTGKVVSDQTEE
jgi:uncharacterized membrane protein YkoI